MSPEYSDIGGSINILIVAVVGEVCRSLDVVELEVRQVEQFRTPSEVGKVFAGAGSLSALASL